MRLRRIDICDRLTEIITTVPLQIGNVKNHVSAEKAYCFAALCSRVLKMAKRMRSIEVRFGAYPTRAEEAGALIAPSFRRYSVQEMQQDRGRVDGAIS